MRYILLAATSVVLLLSNELAFAKSRYQIAQETTMLVAIDPSKFEGREFEGVCFIASATVDYFACAIMDGLGRSVGQRILFLKGADPEKIAYRINQCASIEFGKEIPEVCTVFFDGAINDIGEMNASNFEQVLPGDLK